MRVVFFGTPYFVIPIMHALDGLVGVVTTPDIKNNPSPVGLHSPSIVYEEPPVNADMVEDLYYHDNITLKPKKLDQKFATQLKKIKPDLFVVASYGKIIPKSVLDIPKYGSLNIHPSLLPKYRGPSPIQTAILNGDKVSGITIIKMDEKVDHGPIIYQETLELSDSDNFETLSNKMFQRAADILPKVIEDFVDGKIKPKEQEHVKATYCKQLTRKDGYFEISSPPDPVTLNRMIRAYFPWPGVWTKWQGKVVKFLPNGILQMEGKKPTIWQVFQNNYPNFPSLLLG